MNIYIVGIGGAGLGPMAHLLVDAGHKVFGSDRKTSLMTQRLAERGIEFTTVQDGVFLENVHRKTSIDWVVYSSAIPADHTEIQKSIELDIKHTKRHDILNFIMSSNDQDLIAIAGTHGKTTTTAMMVWTLKQLGIPVSYLIGSNITFGPSAFFDTASKVFVYEADEFDRNFLHFYPKASVITSIDYDHPDTYPTEQSYEDAFVDFQSRSKYQSVSLDCDAHTGVPLHQAITIPGHYNKSNASLVLDLLIQLKTVYGFSYDEDAIIGALNTFPGTQRRFEKLADGVFTDYAHTPQELKASISIAKDMFPDRNISLVFQPHQNIRQHLIVSQGGYGDTLQGVDKVYWLPTYLSREDGQRILSAKELANTALHDTISISELNRDLAKEIRRDYSQKYVIVFCGAGDVDGWARENQKDFIKAEAV